MSASPSLSGVATAVAPAPAPSKPRARGFLHIVRYGAGPGSVYVLTYHRLERIVADNGHHGDGSDGNPQSHSSETAIPAREADARPKPILAEGAQELINLLERIGVDFHRTEVRGALEDILRLGSANIPDLWLSDDEILAKGLAES